MTDPGRAPRAADPETAGPDVGEGAEDAAGGAGGGRRARQGRKQVLLRLDPAVHDALAAWAAAELRSTNAQIEFLLRRALADAGRLPSAARPIPRRGRPPRADRTAEPPPTS
ncbi:hypothetical protein [Actinacidiphila epipremni]|uniref:hypothetical protein n=1 Tax=Actinacidiphila epipremni TaxID=2053013 RepID=UPI002AFE5E80|nr:hypothetical protein [Actinacidiphila epipremni]